jgi:hypothetical protein
MAECKRRNGLKVKHKPGSCCVYVSKLLLHLIATAYTRQWILDTIEDMVNIDNIKHG